VAQALEIKKTTSTLEALVAETLCSKTSVFGQLELCARTSKDSGTCDGDREEDFGQLNRLIDFRTAEM
jgi:hypothetical protein